MFSTPLHIAVLEEKIEAVSDLITQGVKIDSEDENGMTPLELAVQSQNVNISKLLVDSGDRLDFSKTTSYIITAIKTRNIDFLKFLITARVFLENEDENDLLPIHHAVESQDVNIVKLLIEAGVNVNINYDCRKIPVYMAMKSRNLNIMKLLIDAGADVNKPLYDSGETLLHQAPKWANSAIVKLLLDAGANVNVMDNYDCIPLHHAVKSGNVEIVKLLIKAKSDFSLSCKNYGTPLDIAIMTNNEIILKVLVEAGADINARDKNGNTPLHFAASKGNSNIFKFLLDAGADINAENIGGNTPIHCAAGKANLNIKVLIDVGANVNKCNNFGKTPLQILIEKFVSVNTVVKENTKLLIDYTDINLTDKDGKNILVKILGANRPFIGLFKDRKIFECIAYEHVAKLKVLNLTIDPSLLNYISQSNDYHFFTTCLEELEMAKSTKIHNSWVTFLNLLVDNEDKFIKYAGNEDLLKDFEERVHTFSIYGATMKTNVMKGIQSRKLFDNAAYVLSYFLPIFNPTHLVIRNILDSLIEEDWKKLRQ